MVPQRKETSDWAFATGSRLSQQHQPIAAVDVDRDADIEVVVYAEFIGTN